MRNFPSFSLFFHDLNHGGWSYFAEIIEYYFRAGLEVAYKTIKDVI